MDGGRWLDMSAFPDTDPDEAVPAETLRTLRALLREAATPWIDDESWARMLTEAMDGPAPDDETPDDQTLDHATPEGETPEGEDGADLPPPGAAPGRVPEARSSDTGSPDTGSPGVRPGPGGGGGGAEAFDRLRREVLQLFPPLTDAARRLGAEEARVRLEAARERLDRGTLTVVVCGEFKRGKSSLLNALLGDVRGLLPVGTDYTTSVVTTVGYGPAEHVTVTTRDADGAVREEEIDRERIADFATERGNADNARQALTVRVRVPHPRLAGGLTLVDTPGVGGVYQEHTAATAAFLPQADALLFVTDALRPLTDSELAFLRRAMDSARTTGDTDGQIYVLTKTDAVADYTPLLHDTVDKLHRLTGLPADELTVLPVSSRARLDHLASGDPEDLELSNFPALEEALWAALSRRRAKLLLGGALTDLEACALSLLRPVRAEAAALGDQRERELQRLTADYAGQQRRIAELDGGGSRWRADLRSALSGVETRLKRQARTALGEVWAHVNADYLYQDGYLDNPDRLVSELSAHAVQTLGAVNELAAREAARVVREFSTYNGLTLAPGGIGRLPDPPVPTLPPVAQPEARQDADRRRATSSSVGFAVGSTAGGTGGAVLGALVGTVLAPGLGTAAGAQMGGWIGSALGGILGAGAGYRTATRTLESEQQSARREALRRSLAPLRKDQERHVDEAVAEAVQEWGRAVVAELESRVAQERETVTRALDRLAEARRTTEHDALARRAELEREGAALEATRLRVAVLAEEADQLWTRPGGTPRPGPAHGTDQGGQTGAGQTARDERAGSAAAGTGSG
ncbi:dynamin family protein [Streptomyces sp. B1866]|uniref:dynamin family protein n=1 Tax=Streptomyces sp. B1866 TaxID=3075431 RepID=UPI002891B22B|nr:dynamin family protein [Streptomyces sp. B1866]MDT3396027.1 dynamin family protein [Streptomyces sp. B1866]